MYHIESETSSLNSRHLVYRESDSRRPAGRCGKRTMRSIYTTSFCAKIAAAKQETKKTKGKERLDTATCPMHTNCEHVRSHLRVFFT